MPVRRDLADPQCLHKAIQAAYSAGWILSKIDEAIQELTAGDRRAVLAIGLGMPGEIAAAAMALHQWKPKR